MNREEYSRLCQACDAILNENPASVTRAAIAWLHVLNEHPSNQLKYISLFEKGNAKILQSYRSVISTFIRNGIKIVKSARSKAKESIYRHSNSVLFISHLLNEAQILNKADFYFGLLPEILSDKNIRSETILINHSGSTNSELKNNWQNFHPLRTPFPETLSSFREFSIRIMLIVESIRLQIKGNFEEDSFKKNVYKLASYEALSESSVFSLRTYYFTKKVIRNCETKVVISTFEGHAYERMIFAAAYSAKKKAYSLGYHHTIIFPAQHATFRPVHNKFRPNYVLTAGKVTEGQFGKMLPSTSVNNIGIHRTKSINDNAQSITKKPSTCIVLPDGILSEVLIIFRFSISAARLLPEVSFILRLHPVMKKSELLIQYPEFGLLPKNVSFSTEDFDTDLSNSRWALYRGSNSAIYAVIQGVRPIYVSVADELQIDSLDLLKTWKKIANLNSDLVTIINHDLGSTNELLEDESKEAIKFCKHYFMPLDVPKFMNIVDLLLN